jgi:hypothetical protein
MRDFGSGARTGAARSPGPDLEDEDEGLRTPEDSALTAFTIADLLSSPD